MTINREDLAQIDFSDVAAGSPPMAPMHPGEHVADYLEGAGVTQYRLAKAIHVPPRRINEIVQGKRAISADTAVRLARFFGTSELFWMNLQAMYDLDKARAQAVDLEDIQAAAG